MDEQAIEKLIDEAIYWITTTYQTEGLVGLLLTIGVFVIVFGGMGVIFYAAAAANAKSMKERKDDKKDS